MLIKDRLQLVANVPNILSLPESVISSFYDPTKNSPRHIFVVLELKKSSIKHFTNDKIFDFVSDLRQRELLRVVSFDYPLPVTYNRTSKQMLINLKALGVKDVSGLSPNNLYAAVTYAYTFCKIVTKYQVSSSYYQQITNYLHSFYMQVFGKTYGLVSTYSSRIPILKFLVSCYVLQSFFGITGREMFALASRVSSASLDEKKLLNYDFSTPKGFVQALSEFQVMPGLTLVKFTSRLYRLFGVNVLAMIEDCARFFSVLLTSSIPGSTIVPRILVKYNRMEYVNILSITKRVF